MRPQCLCACVTLVLTVKRTVLGHLNENTVAKHTMITFYILSVWDSTMVSSGFFQCYSFLVFAIVITHIV